MWIFPRERRQSNEEKRAKPRTLEMSAPKGQTQEENPVKGAESKNLRK